MSGHHAWFNYSKALKNPTEALKMIPLALEHILSQRTAKSGLLMPFTSYQKLLLWLFQTKPLKCQRRVGTVSEPEWCLE